MRERPRSINLSNARVRMERAQEFAMRHSWEEYVVREACLPGHLCESVHATERDTNDKQYFAVRSRILSEFYRWIFLFRLLSSRREFIKQVYSASVMLILSI